MGGSGNGSAASEARSGRRGGAAARRISDRGRGGAVEKKKLTSGVHASVRGEREGADDGRRESKKKTYFCKYANDARGLAGWAEWAGGLGREELGRSAGRGRGRVAGPKVKKKDF